MRQHIQGIDHVVIVVRDLDGARDTFERMGFALTPRGVHTLGSHNHCAMFGRDYIELLMSPEENPHPARQYYTEFAKRGEGLAALALRADEAKSAYTEMLWAGFQPTDPVEFSRPTMLGKGKAEAKFRITQLAPEKTPGGRVFACEHATRELVWQNGREKHPNGATELAAVAIVCDDVAKTARAYERLFDSAARKITEGLLVETGDTPVAFMTEQALAQRLPNVSISPRPRPFMAALFLRVADRARAEAALRARGLQPSLMPDGSLALGANVAHGVAIVFG